MKYTIRAAVFCLLASTPMAAQCSAPRIRALTTAPVVVVSANLAPLARDTALARGATAFISKTEKPEVLVRATRAVLEGRHPAQSDRTPLASVNLTARQREVLLLLAQGKSNKIIARQLDISENTVRNFVAAILEHLGVANLHEAGHAAKSLGLV